MKNILLSALLIFFFFSGTAKAQVAVHKLVHAGYVYQNQSFGEIGGRLLFLSNDDVIYRIGASALLGSVHKNFTVLPKIQGDILLNSERNVDINHSYYFLGGAELTTKYIAPKIGVSLFGIIDFAGGYAFSLDKKGINGKELKGLNLNFTVNIPLVAIHDLTR